MTVINHAHKNRLTAHGTAFFGPTHVWDWHSGETSLSTQINGLIDKALEDEVARQAPRSYLGGSRVGVECRRQLGYEHHQQRVDRARYDDWMTDDNNVTQFSVDHGFPGKIIRRFQMGHLHEDETARWLRLAGFDLSTEKRGGGQHGYADARDEHGEPRLAGHFDGVVLSGPLPLPYPGLWEHKVMNHKKWSVYADKGVRHSHPVYWAQCQIYMGYGDLKWTLFTALDTDTSELHFEIIDFDQVEAQRLIDFSIEMIRSREPEEFPRITSDPTDWRCRWCKFSDRCWGTDATPVTKIERPAWLAGGAP